MEFKHFRTAAISVLSAFIMSLACLPASGSGLDSQQQRLESKLFALGIIKETGADLTKGVTRSSFAQILVRYMGVEAAAITADSAPFIDVEPSDEGAGAIKLLKNMGHIRGMNDMKFYPDSEILLTEAVSVMVKVMGYGLQADSEGGYPAGHIVVAAQNGMLSGISPSDGAVLTRREMYLMLDNCLDVPVCLQKTFGETAELEISEKNTPLSLWHGTEIYRGVVTANEYTSLSHHSTAVKKGQLEIDGEIYDCDFAFGKEALGMSVDCYIKRADGRESIIYIEPLSRNRTYAFDAADILDITSVRIRYTQDERDAYINLSPDMDLIYNGKAYTGYGSVKNAIPGHGHITGLDRDGDNRADVLFITEYKNIVVGNKDNDDLIIYDKFSGEGLSLYEAEIFTHDGAKADFDDIAEWDVVSAAQSKNTDGAVLTRAYIVRNVISGVVSEVSECDGLKIDGKYFKTAQNIAKEISLGSEGQFYLDYTGKIAAFRAAASGESEYAVIVDVMRETGISARLMLKLFTAYDKMSVFTLADRILLNGSSVSTHLKNGETDSLADRFRKGEVLIYEQNGDGLISRVETADEASGFLKTLRTGTSFRYRSYMFDGKFVLPSSAPIFGLPADLTDFDGYNIISVSSFIPDTVYNNSYKAYHTGVSEVPTAAVMTVRGLEEANIVGTNEAFIVVTDITEVYDNEIGLTKMVRGFSGGSSVEYITHKYSFCEDNDIMPGDIVRFSTNSSGRANYVQKVYNYNGRAGTTLLIPYKTPDSSPSRFDPSIRMVYATVEAVENGYMKFRTEIRESDGTITVTEHICALPAATVVMKVSDGGYDKRVKTVPLFELGNGSVVVMRLRNNSAADIVII